MTDDARERILAAAGRCVERRGDTQIRMAEVADDAGLVRSTVYRYFPTRDDLLLGLVLIRIDAALARFAIRGENPFATPVSETSCRITKRACDWDRARPKLPRRHSSWEADSVRLIASIILPE